MIVLSWPTEPIAPEIARGAAVARAHKGVERTLMEDRQVVGKWWDGRVRRDAETALLLSAPLASRWLGWQAATSPSSDVSVAKRWAALRERLGGGTTLVVRLAELAKSDPLEFGAAPAGDVSRLQGLRWTIRYQRTGEAPQETPCEVSVQRLWQGYEAASLLQPTWTSATRVGSLFETPSTPIDDPLPLGPNAVGWFVVQAPVTGAVDWLELEIQGGGKRRLVRWAGAKLPGLDSTREDRNVQRRLREGAPAAPARLDRRE